MKSPKPWDQLADRRGVTVRDKLVMLGFARPEEPIVFDNLIHDVLDVMLADRAIRLPTHPIRT